MRRSAHVALAVSMAGAMCVLIPKMATTGQPATTRSATRDTDRPRPVTLRSMSRILRSRECDATVSVGKCLSVSVPIQGNERKAFKALFVVFPWTGDKAGRAKVERILRGWNRSMAVVWSNEHWIVVADSPRGRADEHLLGLRGWLIGGLREYRPTAADPDKAGTATRPVASRPRAGSQASQPTPRDQEGLQAELVFERGARRYPPGDDIVVELRLVNKTRVKQKYPGGFGSRNIDRGCRFQIVDDGGTQWSCDAMPEARWMHYKDIWVGPGQSLTIGRWKLMKQRWIERSAGTHKVVALSEALKGGTYYLRWWNGRSFYRGPLYSPFVKLGIARIGATSQPASTD